MTQDEIVYLVYVGFIHIFIPQFLMDDIINVLLFEVGHIYVSFGIIGVSACHNVQNIRVR